MDAIGDAWSSSSPTVIFKQHSNVDIHALVEDKLTTSGYDMHHTAALAATFENLVRANCVERFWMAYRMFGFSVHAQTSKN